MRPALRLVAEDLKREAYAAPTDGDTWVHIPQERESNPGPESRAVPEVGFGSVFEHAVGTVLDPVPEGECGVGPIRGTVSTCGEDGLALLIEWLADRLGYAKESHRRDRFFHELVEVGQYGSYVASKPRTVKIDSDVALVEVTQTACDALGLLGSLALLRGLLGFGVRLTRLDAHRDDRAGLTTVGQVRESFLAGDVVTHVRTGDWVDARGRARGPMCSEVRDFSTGGHTVYVGSRAAERFLRVYNADAKHGAGTGVRWELEMKGQRAAQFAQLVAGSPADDFPELLTSAIRAHVDFVDRSLETARHDRSVLPLLDWWGRFVGVASRARLRVPTRVRRIDRKVAWIGRSVSKSLALVAAYMGGEDEMVAQLRSKDWLWSMLQYGAQRITTDDLVLLPPESVARRRLNARAVLAA